MKETEKKPPENLFELIAQLEAEGVPEEEYKDRIDRYLSYKAAKNAIPLSGQFELTPLCNLDCKMCYVHLTRSQLGGASLLGTEDWKSLMRQAHEAGMMRATLTGGECLTYPGFDELFLYLHSLGVDVSVLTNGVLLDEARIEFFKAHPPCSLRVTLYGSDEDAYEKVTGHRCFETVWQNILRAKEAGLPIRLSLTPSGFMEEDAEALVEKAHASGLNYIINSGLFEPREDTGRRETVRDAGLETYVRMYKKRLALKGKTPKPIPPERLPEPNRTGAERHGVPCHAGRSAFQINWKGEMYACANLSQFHAEPLKDGFRDGWERVHRFADTMPVPSECGGCGYKQNCLCPAFHLRNGSAAHCDPNWCRNMAYLVSEGIFELPEECL